MTLFTDPIAALEEAQFLADSSGSTHSIYRTQDGYKVRIHRQNTKHVAVVNSGLKRNIFKTSNSAQMARSRYKGVKHDF